MCSIHIRSICASEKYFVMVESNLSECPRGRGGMNKGERRSKGVYEGEEVACTYSQIVSVSVG